MGMDKLPLHMAAMHEADGADVEDRVRALLKKGFDPHETDENGNTAFNIAAPASPVTGRLMTRHWFFLAMGDRGPKGLNDPSGSHGSTLAQYIAKWSSDDEIEAQIEQGVSRGMVIDRANASGWTPLAAAAAMGRVKAVEVFARHYSQDALLTKTTEEYRADYGGHIVTYAAGLTAKGVAAARLAQDGGLTSALRRGLERCIQVLP